MYVADAFILHGYSLLTYIGHIVGSFWAAGTSASRGVALLFKACPLLSDVSAYAADPCGRFIAAQGTLSGSHVTMASVYAPVERQHLSSSKASFLPCP